MEEEEVKWPTSPTFTSLFWHVNGISTNDDDDSWSIRLVIPNELPPDPGSKRRPCCRHCCCRPDCPCTVPGGDPFLPMNGDTIGSITFSCSHCLRGGGGGSISSRGSQWARIWKKVQYSLGQIHLPHDMSLMDDSSVNWDRDESVQIHISPPFCSPFTTIWWRLFLTLLPIAYLFCSIPSWTKVWDRYWPEKCRKRAGNLPETEP